MTRVLSNAEWTRRCIELLEQTVKLRAEIERHITGAALEPKQSPRRTGAEAMTDIVQRLRACHGIQSGDPECCCAEAAEEIERLRDMIDNRNEFIADRGLWCELGQYLSEPHALEPKP